MSIIPMTPDNSGPIRAGSPAPLVLANPTVCTSLLGVKVGRAEADTTTVALAAIRDIINGALRREEETGELRGMMRRRAPALRATLQLPEDAPEDALIEFITRYIRSVPGCLRLVRAVSRHQGFFAYAAPFLHMAEDYFLRPPREVPDDEGLGALLDEAFLAHRLLEEVNDHHVRHLQRPLLPVDMTEANIIVHHLLGDAFATRLEELVQFTARQLLDREHLWAQARTAPGTTPLALVSSARIINGPAQQVRLKLAS